MTSVPRLLLIALDSADADLIERWGAAGDLPNLWALRTQGTWGRLGTTADVMHVSAWPTLYTGATPGHHGMYHAYQVRPHEQGVHRTRPADCALPPFWKHLDDAGRRCIIFDAFMSYPLSGFRGIQLLEYGTWTWFGEPAATPRRMRSALRRAVGPYPGPEHMHVLEMPDARVFRDRLVAGARVKADAVRWLLREHPCDMMFVTFGEPHGAGHFLWHTGDPSHPASCDYDIAHAPDALHDVYVAVDQALGAVLEAVGDDTTVAVLSGDGMGPNYSACHHVPELLRRAGWLVDGASHAAGAASEGATRKTGLLSRVRQAIPLGVRQSVTRCLPRSVHYRMSMQWVNAGIDWERTRAFCIPNANEAYIRLNLRGREPAGVVLPGDEATQMIAELQRELTALVNPDNARRAAERVVRTDDVYPGAQRDRLPDIVATWNPDAEVLARIDSPAWGTVDGTPGYRTGPYYTGNHRPNAFVVARGPGIAEGAELAGRHIMDIAPTVLAMLGVDAPSHYEGSPIPELTAREARAVTRPTG
ncbi:MAG TPA: alkaline phosphatase family protein [Gemmatimonadaceae bacterium]|nr:alkaline phosphatase family protein [Gemmatimonadaceae bacterium]